MTDTIAEKSLQQDFSKRQQSAEQVVNLGLSFNCTLAIAKLVAGVFGHSQALLADGINSVSDVVYFIVVKIFVRLSGKPADNEHPYGHYQFESVAALVVGAFVITTGIAIFWDSVNKAFDLFAGRTDIQPIRGFTLWIVAATIVIKIFLMLQALHIGQKTKNLAIAALARDHRNDIFASSGAAIGILLGMLGFGWFDPIAGALVAIVVAKTGFDILREASSDLMDSVPSEELVAQINTLLADRAGIDTVEEVHAHRFGPYLVVNVTIGIDGNLSVIEGDTIATFVEKKLIEEIDMIRKVYVHYHPAT